MTIPVGRAQSKHKLNFLRARRTGFYHRVGTSSLIGSDPSICLALVLQGYPYADLHRMGKRGVDAPPSPSLVVSKHRPSVKELSIWSRKKSLIWGMCSDPPRYYNLINRQAGCSLNLPPPRAAWLFCCL